MFSKRYESTEVDCRIHFTDNVNVYYILFQKFFNACKSPMDEPSQEVYPPLNAFSDVIVKNGNHNDKPVLLNYNHTANMWFP